MADDVDDLLRRAMTTLDRETPAGYFDELPARTLARLDSALDGDGDPGDELARERAARTARAAPAGTASQPSQGASPEPRAPGRRRWGVALLLAGTGLAAAVAVMLFSATRMGARSSEPVALERVRTRNIAQQKERQFHETAQTAPTTATSAAPTVEPTVEPTAGLGRVSGHAFDGQAAGSAAPAAGSAAPGLERAVFETGMLEVAAPARRCFPPGPRGSAALDITVSPSGEVSDVKAAQPYAGTSAEDCAARAVKLHRFPSWSGAPQTFRYRVPMAAGRTRNADQDAPFMK